MFRNELQVIDGKRYIVLECQFRREWRVVFIVNFPLEIAACGTSGWVN